jgi:hypothetical protein
MSAELDHPTYGGPIRRKKAGEVRREGQALGMMKNKSIILLGNMSNLTLNKYGSTSCHAHVSVV